MTEYALPAGRLVRRPAFWAAYVVVAACALALARGHAQSANASMLRGYVGNGDRVSTAVLQWCYAYAEKSLDDFHQLHAAARAGEIEVADDPAR